MKEIYLFSGLGADEKVFQKIDFHGFKPIYIRWIRPGKNQTIEDYVQLLKLQIKSEDPILIGLSFGGLIEVEIAKQLNTKKVILIASAKTKNEIPLYYRVAGKLRIHKLVPAAILKRATFLSYWFFGTENKDERLMLRNILHQTDPDFLRWAIHQIVSWNNIHEHANLTHIHGDKDRILPIRYSNCDIVVHGGGHLMTVNRSKEVSDILKNVIEKL